MPQIDLGQVVGPQGAQGEPGPQGAQGIQGPAGPAATINGVNALIIEAGNNIELSQSGSTTRLSVPADAAPTEDSTKPVQSGGVAAALSNKAPGLPGKSGPVSATGWYRIAVIHGSTSRPDSFIVSIGHNYAANGPSTILASVTTTGYARRITILDSSYNPGTYPIDNLRLISLSGNELALDAHYSINAENFLNSSFILGLSEPSQIVPQAPASVQDSPSGETLEALADWLNPPMQLGVEYRTSERYNGNPVFVMAVNGGAFPDNSSKTIDVQIPDTSGQVKMLDCYGVLDNGTQIPGLFGGSVFDASNYLGLFTQNGNGKFAISVGAGRTVGLNFTLFLKYWKEGT